jgi:hypothetical protein
MWDGIGIAAVTKESYTDSSRESSEGMQETDLSWSSRLVGFRFDVKNPKTWEALWGVVGFRLP